MRTILSFALFSDTYNLRRVKYEHMHSLDAELLTYVPTISPLVRYRGLERKYTMKASSSPSRAANSEHTPRIDIRTASTRSIAVEDRKETWITQLIFGNTNRRG